MQSKPSDVFFSIEFRFETKIGCFIARLRTFAHSYSSTHFLNLQWHQIYCGKNPIFVISMMLMNVFVCPYSFVNSTVIPVHFYYLFFFFKFYYPSVDIIVNHLYLLFLARVKPIQNVVTKMKRNPLWYHLGVASKICSWKYCLSKKYGFLIFVWALQIYWLCPLSV